MPKKKKTKKIIKSKKPKIKPGVKTIEKKSCECWSRR